MYVNYFPSILLILNLVEWAATYTTQPIEFELLDDKFRLSIPNDPDIRWVSFHVNINKAFEAFENGQLSGTTSIPRNRKWSYEFERSVKDNDIIYIWLAVQHNRLIFRDKKDPISVEAYKRGDPNYRLTTTTQRVVIGTRVDASTESPVKPIDVTQEGKICRPTISEVQTSFGARGPYCRDDLIFFDDFDTVNATYWTNEIYVPFKAYDNEFVMYNGTLGVDNGMLKIEAKLNMKHLKKDSISLGERCTSVNEVECTVIPHGVSILPPIISARLSTKNRFFFKYGRVEVRAKMPVGDWLFPLISLQPSHPIYGEDYKSGEIRIAYTRGNRQLSWQNKNIGGGRLFAGAIVSKDAELRHQFMKDTTLPNVEHFGDDFHLYSITWTRDQLIMAVDGSEYGSIKTNFKNVVNVPSWSPADDNVPLNEMFHITLGLAAGGNGDFPNSSDKPWSSTDPRQSLNFSRNRSSWFPTWSHPTLEVDYVRVYAV